MVVECLVMKPHLYKGCICICILYTKNKLLCSLNNFPKKKKAPF